MVNLTDDLDRWAEHGLITPGQRNEILQFEQQRSGETFTVTENTPRGGPGRLANAISTVGAAIAILAVFGLFALLADDWSDGQLAVAAMFGVAVMAVALVGMAIAFLPLVILKRRSATST